MLPLEESVSYPVEQVEIGRDIVDRLALELTEVSLDAFWLCTSTAYLGPRDMLCSVNSGEGGSCDGRRDKLVASIGVRCRGFDQLLGPTKRRRV